MDRVSRTAVLSTEDGRELIYVRFRTPNDQLRYGTAFEELWRLATEVLRARAEATLETQRFDFIPEAKCREILKAVPPIPSAPEVPDFDGIRK